MAIETVFIDGFDHYTSVTDLVRKWGLADTTFSGSSFSPGRSGEALAWRISSGGPSANFSTNLAPSQTLVVGFGFWTEGPGSDSTLANAASGPLVIRQGATRLFTLRLTSTNKLKVLNGSYTGDELAVSAQSLINETWYHIEFRCTFPTSGTGREYEVRVNGETWISGSDGSGSATYADNVMLDATQSNYDVMFDDVYIRASATVEAGGFLGDCAVYTRMPDGPGTHSDLAPTGAATNWEAVDEMPPDGDTSYVSSDTATHKDSYAHAPLGLTSGTVLMVQHTTYARKDAVGYRGFKPLVKSGATEVVESALAMASDYVFMRHIHLTDPDTGVAWTRSGVEAAEFGFEIE